MGPRALCAGSDEQGLPGVDIRLREEVHPQNNPPEEAPAGTEPALRQPKRRAKAEASALARDAKFAEEEKLRISKAAKAAEAKSKTVAGKDAYRKKLAS